MTLGAGRENKDDVVDLSVGVEVLKKVGDYVKEGEALAYLYSNGKDEQKAYERIFNSFNIIKEKVDKKPIILEVIK